MSSSYLLLDLLILYYTQSISILLLQSLYSSSNLYFKFIPISINDKSVVLPYLRMESFSFIIGVIYSNNNTYLISYSKYFQLILLTIHLFSFFNLFISISLVLVSTTSSYMFFTAIYVTILL